MTSELKPTDTSRPPTVWIGRELEGMDVQSAEEWGTIRYAFPTDISPRDIKRTQELLLKEIVPEMHADDLVVFVGHYVHTYMLSTAMLQLFGRVNFLLFSRLNQKYEKKWIDALDATAIAELRGEYPKVA